MLIAALAMQLGVLFRFSHSADLVPQGDDMKFYSDWGLRIAHGQWTDGKAFYGLPGYAYLLAAFYRPLGLAPFAVGLLQAVLFALTAFVIFRLALRVFAGSAVNARAVGVLAALGWTFFTPAQTFSVVLMPTVIVALVYWAIVAWLLQTRDAGIVLPWLWMGLAIGAMSMCVATILFALPMAAVTMWGAVAPGGGVRQRAVRLAAAVAVFASGLFAGSSPAWLHNRLVAHEPVMLSAHSGINFWVGNNPAATGYPKMPPGIRPSQEAMLRDSITRAEAEAGRPLSRAEVSEHWSRKADNYIHTHFAEWLRLMGRKFLNFWNAFQYDDISTITMQREQGITWPGLRFGFVAALGLGGMLLAIFTAPRSRWIAAAVLLHMLAVMPVFVTERYRLAAVPGLLIFAAWWAVSLHARLARREWRPALPLLAVSVATAWFVSIPRDDTTLWSLDYYNAAIHAIRAHDLGSAQRSLKIAESYSPSSAEVQSELGNIALEENRRADAKARYRRALELNPRHDGVLNNLGVMALQEHFPEVAEKFFIAGLEIEPRDASRHYLLARARLERGDIAGARAAIETALKLKPGDSEFLQFRTSLPL